MTTEKDSTNERPPTQRVYELMDDSELSLEEKQRRLLEIGNEFLGSTNGHIQRHTSDSTTHEIIASVGGGSELLPEGNTLDRDSTYCRKTITESSPVAISNASQQGWLNDPAYEEHDIACYLGTTLFVGGELYGTVCFIQREPRECGFTTEEKMFIELVARLLGREIEASRLDQRTQEKEALQEELEKTTKGTLQLASELEERYQRLFETAVEGIYTTTDTLDEYVMANPAFADLLGYESGEELSRTVESIEEEVFVDPDTYATYSETLMSVGELDQFEYRVRTADGEIRWVSDSVTALTDDEGAIDGYRGGVVDITDQKEREQDLIRQQKLNTVLLRVFRHNLRNEFSIIRGYTELMAERIKDESIDEDIVTSAIDRVLTLAEKSTELDAFLMEEVDRKSFDIMPLVRQVVRDIEAEYPDASIDLTGPDQLFVSGYPNLEAALREVLENACKHADGAPTVTVIVEENEGRVQVEVSDDGPGLPEQEYKVLESGTEEPLIHGQGLGLWMVYWVVTGHDGDIETMVTDEGTTVTITLPQSAVETESDDATETMSVRQQSGDVFQNIFEETADALLIIDDNKRTLRVNESATELIGLPKQEILGRSFDEFTVDTLDFSSFFAERGSALQRETATMVRPDGTERIVEYTVTSDIVPGMHLIVCRDVTERRERERRYNAIFNHTYQFTGLLAPDGTVLEANETALEFGGLDREDVIGKPFWEVEWWQKNDATQQELRDAIDRAAAGEFVRYEVEVQGREENVIIDFSLRPITDEQGNVTMLIPEGRDITERKERERELSAVKDRYETLLRAAPDPVFVADGETGEIIETNDAAERLLETSAEEIVGMQQSELHPPDQAERYQQLSEEHVLSGETRRRLPDGSQIYVVTADGEHVPVEIRVCTVSLPDGSVTYGIFRDISERVERERELMEKTRQLEAIVQNTSESIYIKDTEGYYQFINESGAELFDHTAEEIIGKHDEDLFDAESAADVRAVDEQIIESGTGMSQEAVRFIDGEKHVFLDDKYPYRDEEGEIIGIMGISRDISDRKRDMQALERQNERLDDFASVVSHDLRNPLNVARGRLQLAQMECESEHLDAIEHAQGRMETLIDDVLTLARAGQVIDDLEPVTLGALSDDCWQTVETKNSEINITTDRVIQADRSRVQQLLENVFRNAVEHGGEDVTVTIGDLDSGQGFYVEDNGSGVPEGEREKVFEPGYSTDQGTGLGLNIVKQIAVAHGWEVAVAFGSEDGTRFEFSGVEFADEPHAPSETGDDKQDVDPEQSGG